MSAIGYALALLIMAVTVAAPTRAQAQNLDQNKSGPKLFAATCADCHRSARGLAKGRFSITLSYYLRQHYTSNSESAQLLTAYLQSVDTPPRSKAQPPQRKTQPRTAAATTSVLRPPAPVPGR